MLCNFTIHYTKNYLTWANYQTRAIQLELLDQTHFHTKFYLRVTIHLNSKTLGLLFMANHQISVSRCELEFCSHFRPHTHHNTICSTNYSINNPNNTWTVTDCPNGFQNFLTIWFQDLGPIKRPLTTSINTSIINTLKQSVKLK